ncbi:methyltransferase [Streptomyces sp. TRM66268-LWL]|uniref:Methyltransferase n=1 Tax=Streptomyces polyasparticus TaxID=2767826 RepID=A0ABR7SER2_9ACTN|nr:methyltransferase [Streptomyces polyasparticus]MBC9713364.1 methyltransferase [Streptomyces polyasparticus]
MTADIPGSGTEGPSEEAGPRATALTPTPTPPPDPAAAPPGQPELARLADLATPVAIRAAATLRIAESLDDGPRTARELAAVVGADADALERMLAHLATKGVFDRDGDGRYALTELGAPLHSAHPSDLHPWLDMGAPVGRADLSLVELLHSVRTGLPGFPLRYGASFWDDLATQPERQERFDAHMSRDIAADGPAIAAAYDWTSLGRVLDVGGGNGALLIELLKAHPELHGTVLDRDRTAESARIRFTAERLKGRADAVEGSFFDELPTGYGGYLLSSVLHDWDDSSALAILRRCAEAAGSTGRVFVIEKIGGDGEQVRTDMDLRMLVFFAGKERPASQLAELAGESGLKLVAVHPAGTLAVVEFAAG